MPAGLIGARLYHVATDWNRLYADDPTAAFEVWNGGLGIPGGILAGVAAGILVGRHRKIRISVGLDMVAPCLPLAQAIGRLGNWFNQELYGRPTELPWAVVEWKGTSPELSSSLRALTRFGARRHSFSKYLAGMLAALP